MVVSNRNILFQWSIFRCHVSFREGRWCFHCFFCFFGGDFLPKLLGIKLIPNLAIWPTQLSSEKFTLLLVATRNPKATATWDVWNLLSNGIFTHINWWSPDFFPSSVFWKKKSPWWSKPNKSPEQPTKQPGWNRRFRSASRSKNDAGPGFRRCTDLVDDYVSPLDSVGWWILFCRRPGFSVFFDKAHGFFGVSWHSPWIRVPYNQSSSKRPAISTNKCGIL